MKERLDQLASAVGARGGRGVHLLRRPGRTRSDIERLIVRTVGNAPTSLIEWFEWCDGVLPHDATVRRGSYLIPDFEPLALDEAIERYELVNRLLADNPEPLIALPEARSWFPFGLSGHIWMVDCSDGTSEGEVHRVTFDGDRDYAIPVQWPSMEAMVDDWRERFEEGAFAVRDGDVIDTRRARTS